MSKKTFILQDWDKTEYAKHHKKTQDLIRLRNQSKIGFVQAELYRGSADTENQTMPASISSEAPYERWFGMETLSHHPDAVDLSLAKKNGLPILLNHDHRKVVARMHGIELRGDRLLGTIHFSNTQEGADLFQDVKDGILTDMSVGYRVNEMEDRTDYNSDNNLSDYLVTKWQPFEASIVAVPADPTVGFNRSYSEGCIPENTPQHLLLSRADDFQKTVSEVNLNTRKMGSVHDVNSVLKSYCSDMEKSKRQAVFEYANDICEEALNEKSNNGSELVDLINKKILVLTTSAEVLKHDTAQDLYSRGVLGMNEDRQFSITNVIRCMVAKPGEKTPDIGYELEVSQELRHQLGKKGDGLLIPLTTRAVTVGGSGSNIVATDLRPESFIDILRARSQILNLPVTTLNGLVGNVDVPRQTGSATGEWGNFDGTTALSASDITLDKISLTPKTVGGLVTFSRKLIMQGTPDIENLVRQDLARVLAEQVDIKALQGDGTGNTPRGILNTAGIGSGTYVNGGDPTYANIVGMEGNLATNNADSGSMAYITTPTLMATMKTTDVGTDTGSFIWSSSSERGQGQVNGFPAHYTTNMPAGAVLFGNFSDMVVGNWGALELDADPYTGFAKGNVSIRAFMDVDFGVRHPESFTVLTEA